MELDEARNAASLLRRERDDATAALATLRQSVAARAPERSSTRTAVAEPGSDLAHARTDRHWLSGTTRPDQRQRAPHRSTENRANSTASLLGRALAVIGVLAIAVIVGLIVLSL